MNHYDTKRSPWGDIDNAFAPMYNECVIVSFSRQDRKYNLTLKCCVFVDNTDVSFDDSTIDTKMEQIIVQIRKDDWAYVKQLRRGDTLERPELNGKKYKVEEVTKDGLMDWIVRARSI